MSVSPDEIYVQRQLRAAEIALEAARRQRFEADEAMRTMQAEVDAAAARVAAARAERDSARLEAAADVAAAQALAIDATERHEDERRRRRVLEQELEGAREALRRRDELARHLAAEARVRELEGERELVLRRAAEFEQEVRLALREAFAVLRRADGRVRAVLDALGTPPPRPAPDRAIPERRPTRPRSVEDVMAEAGVGGGEGDAAGLDAGRLDAALERLRAVAPLPADTE